MVERVSVMDEVNWRLPIKRVKRTRIEPPPVTSSHDTAYDLRIGNHVIYIVATLEKVNVDALTGTSRGTADVCLSRQIAMYLMHTVFSCPYHRVAAFFARDRTTVSHACRLIEDARDDVEFDLRLEVMENLLISARTLLSATESEGSAHG